MVFVTISGTRLSSKTFSEGRGKLAARGGVIERRADQLQPFSDAIVADQWIEHAVRLRSDTGLVERMLGIADGLDDALLVDFTVGLDVHFRRPMLRIVSVEPRVRDDLHFGGELSHVGIGIR
jgi:hypothetical protein